MSEVRVNGRPHELAERQSIEQFLRAVGFDRRPVIVELNGAAIEHGELGTVELTDGDNLEVVQLVGGG